MGKDRATFPDNLDEESQQGEKLPDTLCNCNPGREALCMARMVLHWRKTPTLPRRPFTYKEDLMSDGDYVAEQRLSRETAETKPYPYYAVFIALYNALFAIFLLFYRRSRHPMEQITPLDLTMLGLSTLRLSKAISEDEVSVVLRKPLVDEAGGERRPQGHGFRYALG